MVLLSKLVKNGYGQQIPVSRIVDIYRNIVRKAIVSNGSISTVPSRKDLISIRVGYEATSCDLMKKVNKNEEYIYSISQNNVTRVNEFGKSNPTNIVVSEDKKYVAHIGESNLVEIWQQSDLMRVIDSSECDEHGAFVTQEIGLFSWSNDGRLMYVCEQKEEKQHLNYFVKPKNDKDDDKSRGDEFQLREDWGEAYGALAHSIIGIYNVAEDKITTINLPNISLGHPKWFDGGKKIVCIGYDEKPFRLGLIYCNNRPSSIYIFDSQSGELIKTIESEGFCYNGIVVNKAQTAFIYEKNRVFGPHTNTSQLVHFDLNTNEEKRLIEEAFISYHKNSFVDEENSFILVFQRELCQRLCKVNTLDGSITILEDLASFSILDIDNGFVLYTRSTINSLPAVYLAQIGNFKPNSITENSGLPLAVTHRIFENGASIIFVTPKADENTCVKSMLPTLCIAHGGPNGNFNDEYIASNLVWSQLGFNVLWINYRGSTGTSQKSMDELCGKVGTTDVEDCLSTIRSVCDEFKLNKDKLMFWGGSHSGFLGAHLSCQSEIEFKSMILRNPVIDFLSLFATSDIPDWSLIQGLGMIDYKYNHELNSDEIKRMFEISPTSRVKHAHVPTLLFLGTEDKRVPMSQGEMWYRYLVTRNVPVECKVYNTGHDIAAKPGPIADCFVSSAEFLLRHL